MSKNKVSFLDKIREMKLTEFRFTAFHKRVGSKDDLTTGEKAEKFVYLEFELADPIPKITSSLTIYHPGENRRVNDFRTDVKILMCSLDDIAANEDEFEFDVDDKGELVGTGNYSGDLFLDLSRSGHAWLTSTKMSKKSSDWKASKNTEKVLAILQREKELTK